MRTVQTDQGPFCCWDVDDITRALEKGAFWDEHLCPSMDAVVSPDAWAIDLGANIGWFTVYLARRFARVLAVEAHPETARLLRQNLTANSVANVDLVCAAAYDTHRFLEVGSSTVHGADLGTLADLDQCHHVAGLSFMEDPALFHEGHLWRVPTVLVDDYVPDGVPVALIKIDVQGAALRALKGLTRTIARCRPVLIVEYEANVSLHRGDDWPDYEDFLRQHGYRWSRLNGPWEDFLCTPEEQA